MSTKPDAQPSPAPERDDRPFLGRWSSRKRGAEAPGSGGGRADDAAVARTDAAGSPEAVPGTDPLAASPGAGGAALAPASGATARTAGGRAEVPSDTGPDEAGAASVGPDADVDEPVLTDADMPPVGTLDANSDLSAFFSKGVSAGLRRAALRHVFRQPAFNVRDGLNDYDGDYTKFEPLGDTVTADMKFHAARLERKRLEEERERLEAEREALERERERLERETAEGGADEGAPVDGENETDAAGAKDPGVDDAGDASGREESPAPAAAHHASNGVPDDRAASDDTSRRDRDEGTAHG